MGPPSRNAEVHLLETTPSTKKGDGDVGPLVFVTSVSVFGSGICLPLHELYRVFSKPHCTIGLRGSAPTGPGWTPSSSSSSSSSDRVRNARRPLFFKSAACCRTSVHQPPLLTAMLKFPYYIPLLILSSCTLCLSLSLPPHSPQNWFRDSAWPSYTGLSLGPLPSALPAGKRDTPPLSPVALL